MEMITKDPATYTLASIQFHLECPLAMQGFHPTTQPPTTHSPTPFPGQTYAEQEQITSNKGGGRNKKAKEKEMKNVKYAT